MGQSLYFGASQLKKLKKINFFIDINICFSMKVETLYFEDIGSINFLIPTPFFIFCVDLADIYFIVYWNHIEDG